MEGTPDCRESIASGRIVRETVAGRAGTTGSAPEGTRISGKRQRYLAPALSAPTTSRRPASAKAAGCGMSGFTASA